MQSQETSNAQESSAPDKIVSDVNSNQSRFVASVLMDSTALGHSPPGLASVLSNRRAEESEKLARAMLLSRSGRSDLDIAFLLSREIESVKNLRTRNSDHITGPRSESIDFIREGGNTSTSSPLLQQGLSLVKQGMSWPNPLEHIDQHSGLALSPTIGGSIPSGVPSLMTPAVLQAAAACQPPLSSTTVTGTRGTNGMDTCMLSSSAAPRRTLTETFPEKLHRLIEDAEREGDDAIIRFFPDGKIFNVFDVDRFTREIMPRYFTTVRYASFQRQLNLHGFRRVVEGPEQSGFYHEFFVKGQKSLARKIQRKRQKTPAGSSDIGANMMTLEDTTTSASGTNTVVAAGKRSREQAETTKSIDDLRRLHSDTLMGASGPAPGAQQTANPYLSMMLASDNRKSTPAPGSLHSSKEALLEQLKCYSALNLGASPGEIANNLGFYVAPNNAFTSRTPPRNDKSRAA